MKFKLFDKIRDDIDTKRLVDSVYDSEKGQSLRAPTHPIGREPTIKEKEQADKRDDKNVTKIFLTFDEARNEYIWDEWSDVKMKEVGPDSVHITGKKGHYLWTDIWDELIWAHGEQSAIHLYLWMINNKLDADALNERKHTDVDWKKILIYGAIGIAVVIVGWGFIPK